jgi:hypothetical protein
MPAGEVDTSVIASAVLKSGTQLPFRFGSLPTSPSFLMGFAIFSYESNFTIRKESVRTEGGHYSPWRDGRS